MLNENNEEKIDITDIPPIIHHIRDYESELTTMINIVTEKGVINLTLPTFPFIKVIENSITKKSQLIIPMRLEANKDYDIRIGTKVIGAYIDFTNDPTPNQAGSLVSLGYYAFRVRIMNARIESLDPLIFSMPRREPGGIDGSDGCYIRFVRPLRRVGP